MNFIQYLQSVITVSATLEAEITNIYKNNKVSKGQYLLRAGERCNDLYFVDKGLVRGYFLDGEKEIVKPFS